MKVRELIEKLQTMPQDADVYTGCGYCDWEEEPQVKFETVEECGTRDGKPAYPNGRVQL